MAVWPVGRAFIGQVTVATFVLTEVASGGLCGLIGLAVALLALVMAGQHLGHRLLEPRS